MLAPTLFNKLTLNTIDEQLLTRFRISYHKDVLGFLAKFQLFQSTANQEY